MEEEIEFLEPNKETKTKTGKQKTTFVFFLETILLETGEPVRFGGSMKNI